MIFQKQIEITHSELIEMLREKAKKEGLKIIIIKTVIASGGDDWLTEEYREKMDLDVTFNCVVEKENE